MGFSRKTIADFKDVEEKEVRCETCHCFEKIIGDKGSCSWWENIPEMFSKNDFCSFWTIKESDTDG